MEVRILWLVLIATIVWALCMAVEASSFKKPLTHSVLARLDSPIARLELAKSQEAFSAVIDQGPRCKNIRIMRINTYMDFLFIVLYCLTLILLVVVNANTTFLTVAATVTVIGTGILDYWENFRLLGLLKMQQSYSASQGPLPRPVSLAQRGLFGFDPCWVCAVDR